MLRFAAYACVFLVLAGCDAIRRTPEAETGITIEAAVFEGGYGIGWHKEVAAKWSAENPGLHVELWGDPRVVDKVKPRFLRGDPPDLVIEKYLPIWRLIAANKLAPFDAALAGAPPGSDTPWGELFMQGMLDLYRSDGHVYSVPTALNLWVCWYDATLFARHGWTPPRTWPEFLALCEQMRAAGVAPLAFQGKYPIYGWWTFLSLVQRVGGLEAINRLNALEPGAFSHADVVAAAAMLQHLAQEHFQRGAMAMSHTESQLEWANGKAGLIFCGLWLFNEMRSSLPRGFDMRCFAVPAAPGGKGNPNVHFGMGSEFVFVPAEGRHTVEALAFARAMISPREAAAMAARMGVISPLKGALDPADAPPPLQSALHVLDTADGLFGVRVDWLLIEWQTQTMAGHLGLLLGGQESPEEFCRALDDGLQQQLANPDVIIPRQTPYIPADFGEGV
jgi:ABC-type glycerol-3-phosphate transport system substrate-binding protein